MKTVIKDYLGKHQDHFWVTANEKALHERDCDICRGRRYIIVGNVAEKCSCTEPPYKLYPQTVLIEECHMIMRMNADLHLLAKHSNARFLIKGEFEGADLVFDNDKNPDCSVYLTLEEARQNFDEDKKKIEGGLANWERLQKEKTKITEADAHALRRMQAGDLTILGDGRKIRRLNSAHPSICQYCVFRHQCAYHNADGTNVNCGNAGFFIEELGSGEDGSTPQIRSLTNDN